jgi:2-dehydropantoate 2-reductase
MTLLVIGGGAIGTLLAARLAPTHGSVVLAARPRTAAAARAQGGLRLVAHDGQEHLLPVPVFASIAAAFAEQKQYDLVIFAVKSYHTATAGQELLNAGGDGLPLLCIQNGVGNEETLADLLPHSAILAGVLTTPVAVLGPAHVKISRPSFKFGLADATPGNNPNILLKTASWLAAASFAVSTYHDYRSLKWSKLLMNMLANAQSAILGYTPAQIFDHAALGNLELRAWREALAVMRALGIKPVALGGYPLPLAAQAVTHLPLGLMRPIFAKFIVGGRGDKMPSLYYDLHPQPRAHSEIAWLNGAVARAGAAAGLPTPVNSTLTSVMQQLISGEENVADWEGAPEKLLTVVDTPATIKHN